MQASQLTVFVVDDDDSVQRALSRLLCSADYNVITFSSVDQFMALDEWPPVACVLADVQMPGLNALLLPELLAEKDLNYPIIFTHCTQ